MSRLSRNREHSFPEEPPSERWLRCSRCGFDLAPGQEAKPFCRGLSQRSELKRSPLKERSPRKQERRKSSLTGERLVFGPVCAWVREQPCFLAGRPSHECSSPPRACHVKHRGKGFKDWRLGGGGRIRLNVLPGCDRAHDELDGRLPGHGGRRQLEEEHGVEIAELVRELEARCPVEPPEHFRLKAESEEAFR